MSLIGLSLALFFTLPALPCPSCGKATDNGVGMFCPSCGSGNLRVSRLWGTHCDACGRSMGSYSTGTIRFATARIAAWDSMPPESDVTGGPPNSARG